MDPVERITDIILYGKLFTFDIPDLKGARIYLHWVETQFYHVWPEDLDPDLAVSLDRANEEMMEELPTWQTRHEMSRLAKLWEHLPPDEPDIQPMQPPITKRPYCRDHVFSSRYEDMEYQEVQRRLWRMFRNQGPLQPSAHGPYYIIHLYSGRRRAGDFQEWMEKFIAEGGWQGVSVISLDTAVDPSMNIHGKTLWAFLMDVILQKRCLGIVLGPPCETWSSARHHSILHADGTERRGPRPLRHGDRLWGLDGLYCKELQQVRVGNILLLKGLLLACAAALNGCTTIVEHPATPFDDLMASIWKLGIIRIRMFLRHPFHLFSKTTIQQWKYGSPGIKPTTLMFCHLNLKEALAQGEISGLEKPTAHLIGTTSDG